jgi:site-specific recombinase XerD
MSADRSIAPVVRFTIERERNRVVKVTTNSRLVNHFLDLLQTSRPHNTWVNYAHDLKVFFQLIPKTPETITRADCLAFIKQQMQAGYADATINRRLAAVSSLFNELGLLHPEQFPVNPIHPQTRRSKYQRGRQSLYRQQAQRIPKVFSENELRTFLGALRSWRDRTLVLLMWISCLRVSEVVAMRFEDLECSRHRIHIPVSKGQQARMVFMDPLTFSLLNRYLDEERQNHFPEVAQIFVAFKGRARGCPLSVNAVQKMIRYYAAKCRLSDVHAHRFRHTGITHLVQQGMAEPAIRSMVGHRSPDSLTPYLHLSDEFVAAEFEKAQAALQAYAGFTEGVSSGGGA